jgi:hypothetical protein
MEMHLSLSDNTGELQRLPAGDPARERTWNLWIICSTSIHKNIDPWINRTHMPEPEFPRIFLALYQRVDATAPVLFYRYLFLDT